MAAARARGARTRAARRAPEERAFFNALAENCLQSRGVEGVRGRCAGPGALAHAAALQREGRTHRSAPSCSVCPGPARNAAHAAFAPRPKSVDPGEALPPWRRATPARRASRCGAACGDAAAAARTPPAARARRGSARARGLACAPMPPAARLRRGSARARVGVCAVAACAGFRARGRRASACRGLLGGAPTRRSRRWLATGTDRH